MLKVLVGNYAKCKSKIGTARFTNDIFNEFDTCLFSLDSNDSVYFLYSKDMFVDKQSVIKFIELATKSNKQIYCIADTIDKKSSFYKCAKPYLEEFSEPSVDAISSVLSDYTNIMSVSNNDVVSVLFGVYYKLKYRHDNRCKNVGAIINDVLVGTISAENAKRLFILGM